MTTCREQSVYLTFPSPRFYRTTKKEKLIRRPQCHCRTFASSKQSHASPSPLHTPRHALHNSPASPLHTPRHTSPHETMPRSTRTQLHPHETMPSTSRDHAAHYTSPARQRHFAQPPATRDQALRHGACNIEFKTDSSSLPITFASAPRLQSCLGTKVSKNTDGQGCRRVIR